MEILVIEGKKYLPTICFSPSGHLEIRGKSVPEDANAYYQPAIDWVREYTKEPQPTTKVSICLEYYNTLTARCMLDIFAQLRDAMETGKSVVHVEWFFEEGDEEMMEAGRDFEDMSKLPFEVRSYKE